MTLAESLLHALKDYGAEEIFGIPGDFALPFFKVIEHSKVLPLFTLSHEPAVGFAADAAARYGSRLGVAAVTYGAGALNMINPIATAYAEKSPLVVVSGAPGAAEGVDGLGLHHQVKHLDSQRLIMNEVTVAQCVLDDAEAAPAEIARALDLVLQFPERFPAEACVENALPYSAKSVIEAIYAEMFEYYQPTQSERQQPVASV